LNKAKTILSQDAEGKREFVPTINKKSQNIKRAEKVEEILLIDAKRRLDRKNNSGNQPLVVEVKPVNSGKSQKVVFQRLVSDLDAVCQHYETDDNSLVSYEKTLQILTDLGFLSTSGNTLKVQEEIWKVLKRTEVTD
jgi:hypothetical protein